MAAEKVSIIKFVDPQLKRPNIVEASQLSVIHKH